MKIGIEVQRLFRKRRFGIEASALELIRSLQSMDSGHQYVVFANSAEDRSCLTESENLKIKRLGGKFFVDFEQVLLPLAASREQVDILHCTGNTRPYHAPMPVVQTLHDVIFMDAIPAEDTLYQRFGNLYRRKVVPVVTPRSNAVITVSEYEKQRIIQKVNVDPARVHVVYNGINEKRFNATHPSGVIKYVRERYQLPDDFILFLGNPAARKNPVRMLEAYVKYASGCERPIPLVTPGLSRAFITQKLAALSYPYDHRQFITPGYVADADLPALYSMSKMFLFPSLSEGFGMPVIEAMACGTPVITSNTSCLPEIAGNAALLVNPLDSFDMAAAIHSISQHDDLRTKLIEAGFKNAKRFSWGRSAKDVLAVYELVHQQAKSGHKLPGFFHKHVFAARH